MPITLKNICKAFGENTVLSNFSYTFETGITLITGKSGCGKTTLARITAGLEAADSGEVEPKGIKCSFMFQEPRLFEWYTAKKNIAIAAENKSEREIYALLDKLMLSEYADMYPREMSGGMQRRTALCRALIYDADMYIFDEPFSGLDYQLKQRSAELIKEYTFGKTVIIISHDTECLNDIIDFRLNLT